MMIQIIDLEDQLHYFLFFIIFIGQARADIEDPFPISFCF